MTAPDWQQYNQRWADIWAGGLKRNQRFDLGKSPPALLNLVQRGKLHVQGKKVFVPGCGRGYDVYSLAKLGATTTGLELFDEAVQAAAEEKERSSLEDAASRATVLRGDFFAPSQDFAGPFDLGFDYTFLCALRPDMRQSWASSWRRYLRPGARLCALMFPVDPQRLESNGPPYPVNPELYKELLHPEGFSLELLERVPVELSHEGRQGKEIISVWQLQESASHDAASQKSEAAG